VLYNTCTSCGSTIDWWGTSAGQVFGSVFWGTSGGADLHPYPPIVYRDNRYGTASMPPPFPSYGNGPIATPDLDAMHRPTATSVLRNALGPYMGFGTLDVYGKDRALGGYSDIGAAEGI